MISFRTTYLRNDDQNALAPVTPAPERFAVNSDDLLLSQGYATISPMTIDQTLQSGLVPVQQVVNKFFIR